MRISDWSSDVCSSDLAVVGDVHLAVLERAHRARVDVDVGVELHHRHAQAARLEDGRQGSRGNALAEGGHHAAGDENERGDGARGSHGIGRSEEHTSELQSLMRISYAVFCLKKKKRKQHSNNTTRKSTSTV